MSKRMSEARDDLTVADPGGSMEEQMAESRTGEGPERTFQGLVVGLALGVLLWSIAILIWMVF